MFHKTESLWNHTTTDHKEREELEDRRYDGDSSCNFGDGTDQRVQSLMFMMMNFVFFTEKNYYVNLNIRYFVSKLQGSLSSWFNWQLDRECAVMHSLYMSTKYKENGNVCACVCVCVCGITEYKLFASLLLVCSSLLHHITKKIHNINNPLFLNKVPTLQASINKTIHSPIT